MVEVEAAEGQWLRLRGSVVEAAEGWWLRLRLQRVSG